ncbi:hypothetical protein DSO57_1033892 [Entomophthora muscae]|uniref:Uncharacterized protein n=1 Tax=Entomophthora muscae TaxID=34485 RepID=A0ACC2TM31_9FUNG|nr:hypothetical protein DSO57_1033892 [Entomophthora muscae]
MTLFLISYNTDLVLLVVIPAMKNVCATAGLMKMTTLPEINMEYWMEYRDLILVKWVPDTMKHLRMSIVLTKVSCEVNDLMNTKGGVSVTI